MAVASVEAVLSEVPAMPNPVLDVTQDEVGFSAEASVERHLAGHENAAFSDACLGLAPVARVDGVSVVRGLDLLKHPWRAIHEATAAG